MTNTPLTKAEREELRRLHDYASGRFAMRINGENDCRVELANGPSDDERGLHARFRYATGAHAFVAIHNHLPRLLADLDAAEAERDDAVALIDAAKSDVRPESFLEHAQAILAKCIAPYSCEQMKAVGDALAACYRKWELMSEVALKAKEDADSMAKCKGCGGTVSDHLAPDQGGCPGSFEIDGVQMVPLAGRDNAVAQRDRAEAELDAERKMRVEAEAASDRMVAERDALKAKLADPRRVVIHETEVVATKEEIASLKARLADLSEADEELHTCRALVNATSENLSVDLERMVDDLADANEKAARSEKNSHSWHELYKDAKAKLAAAESAHSELFLSGQVAELRGKLVALVEAVDSAVDHVDHDQYPMCGIYADARTPCECGVARIRAAIAAARGGARHE